MLLIRDIDSILTLDARRRILERHSVLIGEGRILRIGDTATLDRDHLDTVRRTGKVIEGAGCMMLPAQSRAGLAWTRGPGGRWWKRTRGRSPGAERDERNRLDPQHPPILSPETYASAGTQGASGVPPQ